MVTSLEVSNLDNLFEMVDLVSHCALNQNQIKLNPNQKTCVIEKVIVWKEKCLCKQCWNEVESLIGSSHMSLCQNKAIINK